jgi:hypothetical protein
MMTARALTTVAEIIPAERIERRIYLIRGQKVMLSTDLADLYGVQVRQLNQAVKRNIERFPPDIMFQISAQEHANLKSESVTSTWGCMLVVCVCGSCPGLKGRDTTQPRATPWGSRRRSPFSLPCSPSPVGATLHGATDVGGQQPRCVPSAPVLEYRICQVC